MAETKTTATPVVSDVDIKKQKKAEAAQRCKENKKKRAEEIVAAAKKLKADLEKAGVKLDEADKNFIESLIAPKSTGAVQGSTLTALFGPNPKVGDSVTLGDAFAKTYKGKATIDIYVHRWKEKGIIVEFKEAPKMVESTYTIKAMN